MIKQMPVSEIVRRFAAMLDDPYNDERVVKADPLKVKLTDLLNAIGQYAYQCGVELRPLTMHDFRLDAMTNLNRKLTDELRRFADLLEKRHADVIRIDPGYVRLQSVVRAMAVYSRKWVGVSLGVGEAGTIVPQKLKV